MKIRYKKKRMKIGNIERANERESELRLRERKSYKNKPLNVFSIFIFVINMV